MYSRIFLALFLVVFAAGAGAQENAKKKLYRWVDKQGNVHYDDALPPEAVNQARQEFSAKDGSAAGSVDRMLTPEEQAAREAEEKLAAQEVERIAQQKFTDQAMFATYQNETDLRRAYDTRINVLKQALESTDAGLKSLRATIATVLVQASEAELNNRPVDEKRANTVRDLHIQMLSQKTAQAKRQADILTLDAEFQRMLTRFQDLREPSATPGIDSPAGL